MYPVRSKQNPRQLTYRSPNQWPGNRYVSYLNKMPDDVSYLNKMPDDDDVLDLNKMSDDDVSDLNKMPDNDDVLAYIHI